MSLVGTAPIVNQLVGSVPVENDPMMRCPGYPGAGTRTILSEIESQVGDEEEIIIVYDEAVDCYSRLKWTLNLFSGCIT